MWQQASRLQYSFDGTDTGDDIGVLSLIKHNRSRWLQFLDPLYSLRTAKLPPSSTPSITVFLDLREARDTLIQVLNKVAREAQLRIPLDLFLLNRWRKAFDRLRSTESYVSWIGLRAAYGMALVQIETLYTDNENVYDKYIDVYNDVADMFELAYRCHERPAVRFGLDAGLGLLMRWAFKWCRDPPLRQRMLRILRKCRMIEEVQGSALDAARCEAIQHLEEASLARPPLCAADIPESSRIRWVGLAHYPKENLQRLYYKRSPYTGATDSIWISIPDMGVQLHERSAGELPAEEPDFVFGPGFRDSKQPDGTFWRLETSDFYFAIPKVW